MRALSLLIAIVCLAAIAVGSILGTIESEGHQRLLQSSKFQQTSTEIMMHFRWMVQSWKNVLLRGHESADLDHYWQELLDHHASTLEPARALRQLSDPEQGKLIDEYLANQENLLKAYTDALKLAQGSSSFDYRLADQAVRGLDRNVLIPLDKLIDGARLREQREYDNHFSRIQRIQWVSLIVFLIFLMGLWAVFTLWARSAVAKEEALEIQNSKLQILGRISANIIHEIKNPMTVIDGRCQMIETLIENQNGQPFLLIRDNLKSIFKMNERIIKLIQSISRHSHVSDNMPRAPINFTALMDEVELIVRSRFIEYGIPLTIHTGSVPVHIQGRDVEISQMLVNLLLNAADAIQKSPNRWVKFEIVNQQDFVEFQVHDSGPGIPRATLKKLSTHSFTTKEVGKGTGQGLAITRKIIAEHGGYLSYDDTLPHTCFIVGLPKDHKG